MSRLTGTWHLTRLALRRDRILLPVWVAVFVVMTIVSTAGTVALYPDEASRMAAAASVNDVPTFVALYGRVWDPTSLGELAMIKMSGLGSVFISILAIILVIRHTRAEEESGRTELLEAAPVGAWAQLTAAFAVTLAGLLAIGGLSTIGLIAVGLPLAGACAFGLAWVSTGLTFAAIAGVSAQVTTSVRIANGLAIVAMALAYVVRAIGDVTGGPSAPGALVWLSPIGWGQQVRAFAGDEFVVLLLPLSFTAVVVLIAYALVTRRDLGAGLLPDRAGRARAPRLLSSPLGLAWYQQRWLLLGWASAYAAVSWLLGSVASDLGDLLTTPQAAAMVQALGGSQSLVDGFTGLEFSFFAFVTAAYAIAVARRVSAEEAAGRAELVLSGAVSRTSYLLAHASIALVGATALTVVQGLVFAVSDAVQVDDYSRIASSVAAACVWLPAIWVMAGLALLITGVAPRLFVLAWAALVGFILIAELGALLHWPSWVLDTSPFAHIPRLPGADMSWLPVVVLTALAGTLLAAGAVRFDRRDLDIP